MKDIMMIDCAIGPDVDKDAELIKRVWADDLHLVVKVVSAEDIDPKQQCERVNNILNELCV